MSVDDQAWWETFFDGEYRRLWEAAGLFDDARALVAGVVARLGLPAGARILDAACGFGRVAGPLHARGYEVTGLDASAVQLAEAARDHPGPRYVRGDVRTPPAGPYDAVVNLFTSFGYTCDDAEELRALRAWHDVLVPGGQLLMQLIHRDHVVALESLGAEEDDEDGVLREQAVTDWVRGVREITWYSASTMRTARLRIYTATELVAMVTAAGFVDITVDGDLEGGALSPATGLVLQARRGGR